jgi:hypothetical protein
MLGGDVTSKFHYIQRVEQVCPAWSLEFLLRIQDTSEGVDLSAVDYRKRTHDDIVASMRSGSDAILLAAFHAPWHQPIAGREGCDEGRGICQLSAGTRLRSVCLRHRCSCAYGSRSRRRSRQHRKKKTRRAFPLNVSGLHNEQSTVSDSSEIVTPISTRVCFWSAVKISCGLGCGNTQNGLGSLERN